MRNKTACGRSCFVEPRINHLSDDSRQFLRYDMERRSNRSPRHIDRLAGAVAPLTQDRPADSYHHYNPASEREDVLR